MPGPSRGRPSTTPATSRCCIPAPITTTGRSSTGSTSLARSCSRRCPPQGWAAATATTRIPPRSSRRATLSAPTPLARWHPRLPDTDRGPAGRARAPRPPARQRGRTVHLLPRAREPPGGQRLAGRSRLRHPAPHFAGGTGAPDACSTGRTDRDADRAADRAAEEIAARFPESGTRDPHFGRAPARGREPAAAPGKRAALSGDARQRGIVRATALWLMEAANRPVTAQCVAPSLTDAAPRIRHRLPRDASPARRTGPDPVCLPAGRRRRPRGGPPRPSAPRDE